MTGVPTEWADQGVSGKGYWLSPPPLAGEGRGEGAKLIVAVDPRYFRPTEVDTLLGDATKARQKLGWQPRVTFRELVTEMAREDLKEAERDALVKRHGYKPVNGRE